MLFQFWWHEQEPGRCLEYLIFEYLSCFIFIFDVLAQGLQLCDAGSKLWPQCRPRLAFSLQTASCDFPPKDQAFLLLISPRLCWCWQTKTPSFNLLTFACPVRGCCCDYRSQRFNQPIWLWGSPLCVGPKKANVRRWGQRNKGAGLGAGYSHHSRLAEDPVQEHTLSRCPKAHPVLQAHYWQFLGAAFL